jgi:hypothetical protein
MSTGLRTLLITIFLLLLLPAAAQPGVGWLGIYGDDQGNLYTISDPGSNSLLTLYIIQRFNPQDECTGVRFRIQTPTGASWTYLTFASSFTTIGTANTDISIGYGGCLTSATVIGEVLYLSVVKSPACGIVSIQPAELQTSVLASDCTFTEFTMRSYEAYVNPDGSCYPGPTMPTTWGRVKALYR